LTSKPEAEAVPIRTLWIAIGIVDLAIGAVFLLFGRQLVELGASLWFSYEELAATSRPTRRRVGRTFLFWRVVYALAGAGAVYLGIRGLLG